jgi:hypothetical protein
MNAYANRLIARRPDAGHNGETNAQLGEDSYAM